MRCNFCGSEMTTGGCPKYDCPSKTRPVAPFRPSVWMPESVPAPSAPNSSKISNSSSAASEREAYSTEYITSLHGDPVWEAIWRTIKGWDISRLVHPINDGMYSGPTGDDATRIYDAVLAAGFSRPATPSAEREARDTPQEERLWPVPFDRDGDDEGVPLSREDVQRVMNDICGWFELGRKVVPPDQMLNNVGASLLLGAGLAVQRAVVEKLTRRATPDTEAK